MSSPCGIAYLRRSTGKQERSLEEQLCWVLGKAAELNVHIDASEEMLRKALDDRRSCIGDIYLDDAVHGANPTRPGFTAFLQRAVDDGSLTHCFGWSRDRFDRPDLAEQALLNEKRLLLAGRSTVFAEGMCCGPRAYGETKLGEDLQLYLEYWSAGAYRVDLARKVLRSQGNNALRGYSNGGRPPYGFVRVALTGDGCSQIVPDGVSMRGHGVKVVLLPGEDERNLAKLGVVRRIHHLYHSGVAGLARIASTLNGEGIPSPDAGRTRRSRKTGREREVSGKWTVSSVRGVLEQPLYIAEYAWGRRTQGGVLRFDPESVDFSRPVRAEEVTEATRSGKKLYSRDPENWAMTSPANPFEPIVPKHIWLANIERLRQGAKRGGLRGRPRHPDPNKYPLRVICGCCGEAMCGSPYNGEPCYLCSTYSNSHGEKCVHSWVQRDAVVGFMLRAIQRIIEDSGTRETLKKAIREVLVEDRTETVEDSEVRALEGEVAELVEARRRAYRDTVAATSQDRREDAEAVYAELSEKVQAAKRGLGTIKRRQGARDIDIDAEASAALDLLHELHEHLDAVPPGSLREVFTALGATVTIDFEKRRVGQRRVVPTRIEARLGANGPISIPTPAATSKEASAEVLGIGGRGERIRTSDLCNPIRS